MKRLFATALGFYLLGTSLGLLLRTFFVHPFSLFEFGNAVHAHSHTLYFGWVGLGLLGLAFRRLGEFDRVVERLLQGLAAISGATFVAFLEGGYSLPGIVVSTLALILWTFAAILWLRRARGVGGIDVAFLRVGMIYVLLATLGAWARVAILALGVKDPLWGRLAVFAFLHDFAWFFVFASVGLLARRIAFDEGLLRWQLRIAAPLAWLTFPLGVAGGGEGILGGVARVAALALLVPAALWTWSLWRGGLRSLAAWFGLQAAMEAAGALGLAEAAVQSRHLAILYLHVLLLGYVTAALLEVMLYEAGRRAEGALAAHHGGLAVMAAGLLLSGGSAIGLPTSLARPGLLLAAAGGAAVVAAGFALSWRLLRPEPAVSGAPVYE